ncbi:hypothetical protein V6N13_068552 [Hibiscus sabdariffa]
MQWVPHDKEFIPLTVDDEKLVCLFLALLQAAFAELGLVIGFAQWLIKACQAFGQALFTRASTRSTGLHPDGVCRPHVTIQDWEVTEKAEVDEKNQNMKYSEVYPDGEYSKTGQKHNRNTNFVCRVGLSVLLAQIRRFCSF